MKRRKFIAVGAAGAVSFIIAFPAFAAGRPAQTGYQATFGTVESVEDNSFTLTEKRADGDAVVTISFSEDTAFKKGGIADDAADLAPGVQVVVRGTPSRDGLAAASVNIMPR